MKKFISVILAAVLLFSVPATAAAASEQVTLNVYNWGEYIDLSIIDKFEEAYPNIKVNYTTYDSNESMYSKIVSGAASYDIVIPSDYMISKLIQEDMLSELDFGNIPNYKYIGEAFKNLSYDPDNKYTVPYFWGTVVVIYNSAHIDEEDVKDQSVNLLWNEKYSGKILMFDNPRDAFALALVSLGYSMNSENANEWQEAAELLNKQKPLVQAYVMDAIFDKMESGEAWIAPYYAGDALIIQESNPDIRYYMPKEGTNMFFDSMCVLKTSEHKKEAETFINFMCEPEIAALNAETVGYATPNTEAKKLLDPAITSNEVVYPSDDYLINNTDVFVNLSQETQKIQSDLWTDLKIESSEGEEEGSAVSSITIIAVVVVIAAAAGIIYAAVRKSKRKKAWEQDDSENK